MLKEGNKAPDFALLDDNGEKVKLSDFAGKKNVVLFFYPRANTPGCTREACSFRDRSPQFDEAGAVLLGISPDSVNQQAKFRDKFELNMPLLADTDKKIATKYGVFKEKKMYGKTVMGIERTTFIIGKDGRIKKIFPKVKVDGHVDEVLDSLRAV